MLDFSYDPPDRNPAKPLVWMIIDAAIIAAISFIAALPIDRLPNLTEVYIALRAFAYSFLLQLAVERGIKPRLNNRSKEDNSGGGS